MIVNIVVFKLSMPIVVEVHADLFARMDTISTQNRCTTGRYPHTSQRIGIHLILLDQS